MRRELTISSVFKGHNATQYFTVDGGYDSSIGVDPDLAVAGGVKTSGILVPTRFQKFSGSHITSAPLFIITNPKNTNITVYTATGDVASYDKTLTTESDVPSPTNGAGNGCAYYNNYIYFATPTNIARYGPMDGTPVMAQNVWTSAILGSQVALGNYTYPEIKGVKIPNHPMHFHANNILYVGDVVEGRGVIHQVKTKKGANLGSDDDDSAYNVLDLPSGWLPTTIESWGTYIAIGAITTVDNEVNQGSAGMFLWDTLDPDTFQKGPILLPDPFVTAIKNVNGNLYTFTGNAQNGMRISQYIGGETVSEVAYVEEGVPPFEGAVDALGSRLNWGGTTTYPEESASVLAFGSKRANLPKGIHNVARATSTTALNQNVTAVKYVQQDSNIAPKVIMGWNDNSDQGLDKASSTATYNAVWRSETINVARSFDIKELRIPFAAGLADNMEVQVNIITDDGSKTTELTTINTTNYEAGIRHIVYSQPEITESRGVNNFLLEIKWKGTVELPVSLPIKILIDIDDQD